MPAAKALRASVIIVNFNTRDALLHCLEGVRNTLPGNCEIVVVDNASQDGSATAVRASFPDTVLVEEAVNAGFGAGANRGARRAGGKVLVFLNPDTVVSDGWLEPLVAALEADGDAGLATAQVLLAAEPSRLNTCGNDVHVSGLTLCRGMGVPKGAFQSRGEVNAVSGAVFSIQRSLFESLGGFDEDFFLYLEDTDLSLRARLAGWRSIYIPESVVLHDYILKLNPRKLFFQERNRYAMLLKLFRWPTLIMLLPVLALAELMVWGFLLRSQPGAMVSKLRAYLWVPAHWGDLMRKRREAQRMRAARDRELLRSFSFRLDFSQTASRFLATLAGAVFDPVFFVLKRLALAVVWW